MTCHCEPMWSCCKAGVILITYASRNAKRHGSPKAAGMRCEPSCLMANAPLWSALWNALTWRPRRALCCAIQTTVPQTSLGVTCLDLGLLCLEIWALFFDLMWFSIYSTKPDVLVEFCWTWRNQGWYSGMNGFQLSPILPSQYSSFFFFFSQCGV